jgi:hypothetical protein
MRREMTSFILNMDLGKLPVSHPDGGSHIWASFRLIIAVCLGRVPIKLCGATPNDNHN